MSSSPAPSDRDAHVAAQTLHAGLHVRQSSTGPAWFVYDLGTNRLHSIHSTEAQAQSLARQINEQTGIFVCEHGVVDSEGCGECREWADGWHRDHEEAS